MLNRPIVIFILFLVLLGLGTVWVVQEETGTRLLPSKIMGVSKYQVRQLYIRNRFKFQQVWKKLTGESDRLVAIEHETPVSGDKNAPQIIKWQDEKGVWHYEYQRPVPPPAQE